jgi:hypothetical protein
MTIRQDGGRPLRGAMLRGAILRLAFYRHDDLPVYRA